MIRKHFRFKRFALGLAFAAVVGAVLVPTAVAKPVGYEVSTPRTTMPQQASAPTARGIQADGLRYQAMAKFYKDNQPGITAAGTAIANQQHNAYPVPVTASSVGSNGFSWSDAGIGASAVFAGLLVLLTVVGLGRRHRSRGLASA